MQLLLSDHEALTTFPQETKALRQLLRCEIALQVIDARDRILPRHKDELEILARCGLPIVPVLNFVADPGARTNEWKEALARLNLHAVVEFDTVVFDAAGEELLYEKMATLLDSRRKDLLLLKQDRQDRRRSAIRSTSALVADLLIDAAAAMFEVDPDQTGTEESTGSSARDRMQDALEKREARCTSHVLSLFGFENESVAAQYLVVDQGRFGLDLFSPESIRIHGRNAAAGAAGGAAAGAGIDLVVGGLSLGAAAAIGALVGGVLGSTAMQSRRLFRLAAGGTELRCGDGTIELLLGRQMELARALLQRGHASQVPIDVGSGTRPVDTDEVVKKLKPARAHPEWSSISSPPRQGIGLSLSHRHQLQQQLGELLVSCIEQSPRG